MTSPPSRANGENLQKRSRLLRQAIFLVCIVSLSAGCTILARHELDGMYGKESVRERLVTDPSSSRALVSFRNQVKPILDRRCVVCHGCFDAPCQLKLSTIEGIDRGATKEEVYDGARLSSLFPTRLYVDADSTEEWRQKDFFPVLNERVQSPSANLNGGVMSRLLDLKLKHPLPDGKLWPSDLNFSSSAVPYCPTIEEMDSFERNYSLLGMPFGLPPLPNGELETLKLWLVQGARAEVAPPLPANFQPQIDAWESFFNGSSIKERLMSRYFFEHLFLADFVFENVDDHYSFRLVRSKTAPGLPIQVIPTRRPFDDPGTDRPYYRLQYQRETPLIKNLMRYPLSESKLERFKDLFVRPNYDVVHLPAYKTNGAPNPFEVFGDIPFASRYQFMLDNAQFIIMSFIKGPVCKGNLAVNVISDRFWILFFDPRFDPMGSNPEFFLKERDMFNLPSGDDLTASTLLQWIDISRNERRFLEAKRKFIDSQLDGLKKLTVDYLWKGDGGNQNAALTVMRHYDSSSVVRGLVGETPKTAWVLTYPLFERIHYLLVAGFDVFGHAGHQLTTRLYMDFLRMEAEQNFLAFMPNEVRSSQLLNWYRGMDPEGEPALFMLTDRALKDPGIEYRTGDPKQEFFDKVRDALGASIDSRFTLSSSDPQSIEVLSRVKGLPASWLAEVSFLKIQMNDGKVFYYSIILDRALQNVSALFAEDERHIPREDRLTVVPGLLGAYPNALFTVTENNLSDFVSAVSKLDGGKSYEKLVDRYGIRRANPAFWELSDPFQEAALSGSATDRGLLDFSRLENR